MAVKSFSNSQKHVMDFVTQLENTMLFQSQNPSLEPTWNEVPHFFLQAKEKYAMENVYGLTLL